MLVAIEESRLRLPPRWSWSDAVPLESWWGPLSNQIKKGTRRAHSSVLFICPSSLGSSLLLITPKIIRTNLCQTLTRERILHSLLQSCWATKVSFRTYKEEGTFWIPLHIWAPLVDLQLEDYRNHKVSLHCDFRNSLSFKQLKQQLSGKHKILNEF